MAQITISEVRKRFPQYDDIDDDRLLEAVRQRYYADMPAAQFSAMVVRDLGPREAKLTDDWRQNTMRSMAGAKLKDMSWLPKAALNFGSGVQELVTGAQQRFNDLFGSGERKAELQKRAGNERALAQVLADNTAGGTVAQIAGNVAPTMVIPAGGVANATSRAATILPRAYRALRTGQRLAPAATTTARMGTAGLVADSALAGALYGALQPTTEGESAGENMLMSAGSSALLPGVGVVGNQIRRMATRSGGGERAAERIVEEVAGEGASQAGRQNALQRTLAQLRGTQPTGPIPLTVAAQLDSPDLARLERGSRARNAANWSQFDEDQARAVADQVNRATGDADLLAARKAARGRQWDRNVARAGEATNLNKFGRDIQSFRADLNEAMLLPESSNPAVRGMLKAIADDIDRVTAEGVQYTPEHLAAIRANLSGKYNPMQPNALAGAPRESPMRITTLDQVDYILNRATDGKWSNVVGDYAQASRGVDRSKAAGRVRDSFYDQNTGRVLGVAADSAGDVPKVTESGLGRAMNRARGKDGVSQLSPRAEARLSAVLEALRRQGITQRVAKSATAGGGSNTASDTIAAETAGQVGDAIAGAAGVPTWVSRVGLGRLEEVATANRDRALADALQNPQELLRILEQLERSGRPLSPEQSALLNLLRSSAAATATN